MVSIGHIYMQGKRSHHLTSNSKQGLAQLPYESRKSLNKDTAVPLGSCTSRVSDCDKHNDRSFHLPVLWNLSSFEACCG